MKPLSEGSDYRDDPRIYLSAERTLLSWVRTSLAMMGFGFVVARFGLFMRELAVVKDGADAQHDSLSLWMGTALIIFDVVVNIFASIKHWRYVRQMQGGQQIRFQPLSMAIVVAAMLIGFGVLMAWYLVFGLQSS